MPERTGQCELCGREVDALEKHHLIPRTRHSNKKNKRRFDRREVHERVAWLCNACHKTIHAALTTKELEYDYNTLEALRGHAQVAAFVEWVRSQRPGKHIRVRRAAGARSSRRDRKARPRKPGGPEAL